MRAILALSLLLAGCSAQAPADNGAAGGASDLETAAIAAGAIPDPRTAPIEGLYERSGDGGPDRVCLLRDGGESYRIGIDVMFGDETECLARGNAVRNGERVSITLAGKGECRIEARFDGREIALPGSVPDGCAAYCTRRGSLAGFALGQSSASRADAASVVARDGALLCEGPA
ncbi:hypothetical protein [Sphingomonas colocasiae]|uniref:DUF3617 family protein n=1 Tax=Sphingomonas colocasiae TaxID=1848973 RepID=A0ABS7PI57_9SPHN|nr:hypothetical protein [Sphingomonas colocasiae]MBY8820985.1 hypothetical protein [Sphingomonas colocasiae]